MRLAEKDGSSVNRHSFFDDEVFQREREHVLRKTWQFVAHESEIARGGDYVTRKLAGDEVIVSRDKKGVVRVLLNSCRHRGVKLCAADHGRSSIFRCGYHGWAYGSGGELLAIPQIETLYPCGIDKEKLGLVEARSEIYQGLIFATFDTEVPPLLEALGDMAWYLDTVFGRFEYEVFGPPLRSIGEFNWKSGAENWTGDAAHGDITHKTVVDAGLFGDADDLIQSIGDLGGESKAAAVVAQSGLVFDAGGGHAGVNYRLPIDYEKPVFFGFDPSNWAEAVSRLTPEQLDFATRRPTIVANVFPNFSFIDSVVQNMGNDSPPTSCLNVRLWYPISATQTEVFSWTFVPKNAPREWKLRSQTALARSFNLAGMFDLDDFHNWNSTSQANVGPEAIALSNDYSAVPAEPTEDTPFPGKVYEGAFHDVNFRVLYAEWARRMNAGLGSAAIGSEEAQAADAPILA